MIKQHKCIESNLLDKKTIISIIIPIYNAELYLQECVESVIRQSFIDYELILVNDGSTDGSLAICRKYNSLDDRIIVVEKENGGVSSARNAGLSIVKGKWITFIDADDYLLPDALSVLYNNAVHTDSDLVLANTLRLKDGDLSPFHKMKGRTTTEVVTSLMQFSLWGYLFRSEIIKKTKLQFVDGLAYSEDRVFIYQFALRSTTITYCNTPVYVYRIHANSACQSPNGVRKAYHHFWAASELALMAKSNRTNKKTYTKLNKEKKFIINLGTELFVMLPFAKSDYVKVKDFFLEFNDRHWISEIKFSFIFVKKYLRTKRRQIITFRKSIL